ncbi:lytic transglycosylase domain-containing protein [Acidithiobacillus thiooxidans]|uniref:transglycosylase SLT domain-containing protein n=1 Tax=Acidithiobacillus thiooxidans TaxID=930 RepID=UPI001C07474E|nr:transglycosylase SLT domain-containing protein [Acidithiobacillus thiooxidans]MBU2834416.1 lytic transglycosylase domain-containing protein [Acidithiobacillus thiooxidans]
MVIIASVIQKCAVNVAPSTMTAIVRAESGLWPWSIDDDTTGKSYHLPTENAAIALAKTLQAQGHNFDLGLAQVNIRNVPPGWSLRQAFSPCANVRVGSHILWSDYQHAAASWGPGLTALKHSLEAYNSGQDYGDLRYVADVEHAAGYPVPAIGPIAIKAQSAAAPGGSAPPSLQSMEGSGLSPSWAKQPQGFGHKPVAPSVSVPKQVKHSKPVHKTNAVDLKVHHVGKPA